MTHHSKYKPYKGNFSNWSYLHDKKTWGLFQTEMTGTTSTFGRDKSLEVKFSGSTVRTEGSVITFPALDSTAEIQDDVLKLCRGYVDTEAAKVRFSNRNLVEKIRRDNEKKSPLLNELFKVVESVRAENEYLISYPGAVKNLGELTNALVDQFKTKSGIKWSSKSKLPEVVSMALLAEGRKDLGCYGYGMGDLKRTLEWDDQKKLEEWSSEINDCTSTEESFDLAKRIYEDLKDESSEDSKEEEQEEQILIPDLGDLVTTAIQKELKNENGGQERPYYPLTLKYDRVHHWSDPTPSADELKAASNYKWYYGGHFMKRSGNISKYLSKVEKLGPIINVARRKLELMIASKRRTEWDFTKEAGKIDGRRLSAAVAGDPLVFKTKENAPEIDTAMTLMVDLSGSMNGYKRSVATDTAIVLAECLAKIGIPFEILGFDNTDAYIDSQAAFDCRNLFKEGSHEDYPARLEPQHLYVFKSFKDRFFDARPYIMGLENNGVGGANNVDGESLLSAHERLKKRPEKRKIMFVLSDGMPSAESRNAQGLNRHLGKAVKMIEKSGTDIIGIGIQDANVSSFYSRHVICNDVMQLASTVLKTLSELLVPSKRQAA